MRLAFSTVACPDWTLPRAIALAEELGYDGLEMRTFGEASNRFACDPALTGSAKVGAMLRASAVSPACVATGIRFVSVGFPGSDRSRIETAGTSRSVTAARSVDGWTLITSIIVCNGVAARNGGLPVNMTNNTAPKA